MRSLISVVCAVGLFCCYAPAQVVEQQRRAGEARQARTRDTMMFISHEMGGAEAGDAVVKGAPFSAESVTEFRQTLGDGNVIERTSRGAIYRDSEGRTRREQPLSAGPAAMGAVPQQVVIIRDPVAGVQWTLNSEDKVAIKTEVLRHASAAPGAVWVDESRGAVQVRSRRVQHAPEPGTPAQSTAVQHVEVIRHDAAPPKVEDLGTQTINGVPAEGSRTSTTLATGTIGNVRPIEIVTERWFSPQLKTTVRTRSSDPRTGDYSFELTNIRQGEPSPALFQVPPDYEVREAPEIRGVPGGVLAVPHGRQQRQEIRHSQQPREE